MDVAKCRANEMFWDLNGWIVWGDLNVWGDLISVGGPWTPVGTQMKFYCFYQTDGANLNNNDILKFPEEKELKKNTMLKTIPKLGRNFVVKFQVKPRVFQWGSLTNYFPIISSFITFNFLDTFNFGLLEFWDTEIHNYSPKWNKAKIINQIKIVQF